MIYYSTDIKGWWLFFQDWFVGGDLEGFVMHVINVWLKVIEYHQALHGLQAKQSTRTAILESVMQMQETLL